MHQELIFVCLSDYSVHFYLAGANSSKFLMSNEPGPTIEKAKNAEILPV